MKGALVLFQNPDPAYALETKPARMALEASIQGYITGRLSEADFSSTLETLIPEWSRLTSRWNIQHKNHHFPLDAHTMAVFRGTVTSPYFSRLASEHQLWTAIAALLHDIEKNCGPKSLHNSIPVDRLHSIQSAQASVSILQRLGFSGEAQRFIYPLIHHHQIFGRLFFTHKDQAVPEGLLKRIAVRIRCPETLLALMAITEGDIRGVHSQDTLFTPSVCEALQDRYQRTLALLPVACYDDIAGVWIDKKESEKLSQGGAFWLSLRGLSLSKPAQGICLDIGSEHIAWRGPRKASFSEVAFGSNTLVSASMALFYQILLNEPYSPDQKQESLPEGDLEGVDMVLLTRPIVTEASAS
jgi:hypothetical protein